MTKGHFLKGIQFIGRSRKKVLLLKIILERHLSVAYRTIIQQYSLPLLKTNH